MQLALGLMGYMAGQVFGAGVASPPIAVGAAQSAITGVFSNLDLANSARASQIADGHPHARDLDDRRLPARHLPPGSGVVMAELYVYQPFKLRDDRGAIAVTDDADRHLRDKILAVLFTAPGERVNAPRFGVGLDRTVFEGLDELTVAAVEFRIAEGVRRELGDEALIDARRRRDRSRQRTAADLDRLPPPLGPQSAQPGDRPVSDAPLSWDGGAAAGRDAVAGDPLPLDRVPARASEHPAIVTAHLNQPVGSLTADHVVVSGGRRLSVPRYEVDVRAAARVVAPLPRLRRPLAVHGRAHRRRRGAAAPVLRLRRVSLHDRLRRRATAASRRRRLAARPPSRRPSTC